MTSNSSMPRLVGAWECSVQLLKCEMYAFDDMSKWSDHVRVQVQVDRVQVQVIRRSSITWTCCFITLLSLFWSRLHRPRLVVESSQLLFDDMSEMKLDALDCGFSSPAKMWYMLRRKVPLNALLGTETCDQVLCLLSFLELADVF